MSVQWFPGHMTRARRQIEEKLKLIDIAVELLDARAPLASRNPMIDEILGGKPRLIILNKADLADPRALEQWKEKLAAEQIRAIEADASSGKGVAGILPACRELLREKREARERKGMAQRAIRALIVGIPNVGKSTLINRLAGRNIAATGDRPGVTKGQQWIKVGSDMELLDTPGILWPKFEDPEVGLMLASLGSVREEILNIEDIAFYAIRRLLRMYPEALRERFGVEELPQPDDDADAIVLLMEEIGRKRGCLMGGGRVDLEKASGVILRDLRAGKLGRINLQWP